MLIPAFLYLLVAHTIPTIISLTALNCYHARHLVFTACALPNFHQMRTQLCSSTANWGEGFPFLSGHGVVLRLQDNCTVDDNPNGIDLTMTISSTVKGREDCWERTKSIIEKCVGNGGLEFNGGEWWDLDGEEKTFIWTQYLHVEPPAVYNGSVPYYGEDKKTRAEMAKKAMDGPQVRNRGTTIALERNEVD